MSTGYFPIQVNPEGITIFSPNLNINPVPEEDLALSTHDTPDSDGDVIVDEEDDSDSAPPRQTNQA